MEAATDLVKTRLLMLVHLDNPLPAPLLIIVIVWLAVIFRFRPFRRTQFAGRNRVTGLCIAGVGALFF